MYTDPTVSMMVAWMAGWLASSASMRDAPLSSTSRAVTVLPRASLGSMTRNKPMRKLVVRMAASASLSARAVCRWAALRWNSA